MKLIEFITERVTIRAILTLLGERSHPPPLAPRAAGFHARDVRHGSWRWLAAFLTL